MYEIVHKLCILAAPDVIHQPVYVGVYTLNMYCVVKQYSPYLTLGKHAQ